MFEIVASQFFTQNCLNCYSKLNLDSKFHAEVATHFPQIILRKLYSLRRILYYNNCYSIATNCDPIHDLSGNFHAKIATQWYKIISNTVNAYSWKSYDCISYSILACVRTSNEIMRYAYYTNLWLYFIKPHQFKFTLFLNNTSAHFV